MIPSHLCVRVPWALCLLAPLSLAADQTFINESQHTVVLRPFKSTLEKAIVQAQVRFTTKTSRTDPGSAKVAPDAGGPGQIKAMGKYRISTDERDPVFMAGQEPHTMPDLTVKTGQSVTFFHWNLAGLDGKHAEGIAFAIIQEGQIGTNAILPGLHLTLTFALDLDDPVPLKDTLLPLSTCAPGRRSLVDLAPVQLDPYDAKARAVVLKDGGGKSTSGSCAIL